MHAFSFLLFWLLVGHAVADYPLQGDFLSKAKNFRNPIPGFPWWIALSAHAMIHAGAVALVTDNYGLAFMEFIVHFMIDMLKCNGSTDVIDDQLLHVICKIAWTLAIVVV